LVHRLGIIYPDPSVYFIMKGVPMKIVFSLLASSFFFLLQGAELLQNGDFETGTLSGWFSTLTSPSDRITPKAVGEYTDIYFYLDDGGTENWEVSLLQAITVRKGYRYAITFGGAGIEGNKPINFGINHNGGTGNGGDGSGDYTTYFSSDVTMEKSNYGEFRKVWDNTSISDAQARIFFNGGGNDIDFFISWVSVWESPLDSMPPSTISARFTHLGFYENGSKRIVVKDSADSLFQVRSSTGAVLLNGQLSAASL
jgi:hypothetical protein